VRAAGGWQPGRFNWLGEPIPDPVAVAAPAPAPVETVPPPPAPITQITAGGSSTPAARPWDNGGSPYNDAWGGGGTAQQVGPGGVPFDWGNIRDAVLASMGPSLTGNRYADMAVQLAQLGLPGPVGALAGIAGMGARAAAQSAAPSNPAVNPWADLVFDENGQPVGTISGRPVAEALQQAQGISRASLGNPNASFDPNSLPGYGGMGRPSGMTGYPTTNPITDAQSRAILGLSPQGTPPTPPATTPAPTPPPTSFWGSLFGIPATQAPAPPAPAPSPNVQVAAVPGGVSDFDESGAPPGQPGAPPDHETEHDMQTGGPQETQHDVDVAGNPSTGAAGAAAGAGAAADVAGGSAGSQTTGSAGMDHESTHDADSNPGGHESTHDADSSAPSGDSGDASHGGADNPGGGTTGSGSGSDVSSGSGSDSDPTGFSEGGTVQGGTPGIDSVPITAQQDEYMLSVPFLEYLNQAIFGVPGVEQIHNLLDEAQEDATGETPNNADSGGGGPDAEDAAEGGEPGGLSGDMGMDDGDNGEALMRLTALLKAMGGTGAGPGMGGGMPPPGMPGMGAGMGAPPPGGPPGAPPGLPPGVVPPQVPPLAPVNPGGQMGMPGVPPDTGGGITMPQQPKAQAPQTMMARGGRMAPPPGGGGGATHHMPVIINIHATPKPQQGFADGGVVRDMPGPGYAFGGRTSGAPMPFMPGKPPMRTSGSAPPFGTRSSAPQPGRTSTTQRPKPKPTRGGKGKKPPSQQRR
jgi:hypothetical protein